MKKRIVRKNKKRIDPRYFSHEYLELEEEKKREEEKTSKEQN
jgi:hypothetical protein